MNDIIRSNFMGKWELKELGGALKLLFPDSVCQTRECTISFEGIMRLGARDQKPKLAQRVYEAVIYYS